MNQIKKDTLQTIEKVSKNIKNNLIMIKIN